MYRELVYLNVMNWCIYSKYGIYPKQCNTCEFTVH